jgi:chromosome segregation ATPase
MDMVTIILFVLAEIALLLGVATGFLLRKNSALNRRLTERASNADGVERFASIESGYLPYLEKQIIDTRARLELSETESGDDNGLSDALHRRMQLLAAEKKVTELCNDYPKARWEHVLENYRVEPQPEPESEQLPPETDAESDSTADDNGNDDPLQQAQQRIRSLEVFRDHFFQMKQQLGELEVSRQKLAAQLDSLLPAAERSQELQDLIDTLNRQKDALEEKAARLGAQADDLSGDAGSAPGDKVVSEVERVTQLHGMLGEQGHLITSMKRIIKQVKAEPQAELIAELEKQLRTLDRRYQEASTCIEIMEQQNQRLQDKIDRTDRRAQRIEAEKNESISDLHEQLGRQKSSISGLNTVIGDLQLEAGKAAELQAKLDQFELASRDMNMCVQVLEEENHFLQEQVKALLNRDEGESVYDAEKHKADVEALQQQVETLKTELAAREERIHDVEAKFAALEKEYLTLYEEANS